MKSTLSRGAFGVGLRVRSRGGVGTTATSAVGLRVYNQRQQHHQQQGQQQQRGVQIAAVIMGAPGSGKGTISAKILRDFQFAHISTGDLLRDEIQAGSEKGTAAKTFMAQGKFVPDELIFEVLMPAVERAKVGGKHILLDGFPRSASQAMALKGHLPIDMVINLDVPRETIIDRLTDRWIHPRSGRVYAYAYRPPKEHGKDDVTGEALVRRDDDEPQVVEQRFTKYEKTTRPLLDLYAGEGLLHSFSGRESDVLYRDVREFLSKNLPHTAD